MPTREDREAFIEDAVRRLREEAGAERVVLFGSQTQGRDDRHSDVDLLVVLKSDEQPLDRRVRIRRLLSASRPRVPFDLVVLTPAELEQRLAEGDAFVEQILDRGRTLHAA